MFRVYGLYESNGLKNPGIDYVVCAVDYSWLTLIYDILYIPYLFVLIYGGIIFYKQLKLKKEDRKTKKYILIFISLLFIVFSFRESSIYFLNLYYFGF